MKKRGFVFYTTLIFITLLFHCNIDQPETAAGYKLENRNAIVGSRFNLTPGSANGVLVSWSTSDQTIAEVDENGMVTTIGEGAATITATSAGSGEILDSCVINVFLLKQGYGTGKGPDETWFTQDDKFAGEYTGISYDKQGKIAVLIYFKSGADNIAFNDDDQEIKHLTFLHNDSGQVVEIKEFTSKFGNTLFPTLVLYESSSYDSNGQIVRTITCVQDCNPDTTPKSLYSAKEYDKNENLLRVTYYNGAGSDETWYTADDEIQSCNIYEYNANGHETKYIEYTGAGTDGIWFTQDDAFSDFRKHEYSYNAIIEVNRIFYSSAGPDQLPFTADDEIRMLIKFQYDAKLRLLSIIHYSDPGADLSWFTADDTVINYRKGESVDNESESRLDLVTFNDPGPDLTWFTGDDTGIYRIKTIYNLNNQLIQSIEYTEPGNDSLWMTPDDAVKAYSMNTYNPLGKVSQTLYVKNPGADLTWFTSDDVATSFYSYLYNDTGELLKQIYYESAGSDGIAFTADDVISSYTYTPNW